MGELLIEKGSGTPTSLSITEPPRMHLENHKLGLKETINVHLSFSSMYPYKKQIPDSTHS